MSSVKNYLLNLNLFESSDDSVDREDEHRRRSNIIATRVYLIVLALALITLSLVSWLTLRTTIVTVEYPSKVQFEALPFDAHCPCSRMSIAYGEFTSIQSTFHQVCSSDFVSDRWIEAIYSGSNATYFDIKDFRRYGSAQFQALASFCRLSNASVVQSISLFHRTSLISLQVQSETVFKAQVQASIEQFQSTAPNQFEAQLQLVREMITGNRLNSGLQTNNILFYGVDSNEKYGARSSPISYPIDEESLCSCFTDLDCGTDSIIMNVFEKDDQVDDYDEDAQVDDYDEDAELDDYDEDVLMFIPGFVAGCLPVNSLLLSTLECFYSQTCLNELLSFFPTTKRFTAMIASKKSHFKSNSTIKTIVDRLMIEEWIPNISYDKYYAQCAPILCTYSKHERHDFLFVLTRLIRLLGGLTVIFGLIIPILIRFIRRPRNVESIPCKCDITRILCG
jgi:hypothetical protein